MQELFTAKHPFHTQRLIRQMMQGPPNRPTRQETYSRLTNKWWQICSSCWKLDPSLRPSMSELVEAIATTLDETSSRRPDRRWAYLPIRNP